MTGWQRLKIVLSMIYWLLAGMLTWGASQQGPDLMWFMLMVALVIYAIAAAIWWAFAGFDR